MEIHSTSGFKSVESDHRIFTEWVSKLELHNNRKYDNIRINTSLGKTQVWGVNTAQKKKQTLVVFPGARTTSLIWDFDNALDAISKEVNVFLVETNGLPNLSDGNTPDIKSLGYGQWASEVLDGLGINKAFIAGASFGGLICMKLAIVNPDRVEAAFLLNPGCLQPFSLSMKNLYYNILPLVSPSEKNVRKFLDKAILFKPNHQLSDFAEKMLVDYEVFAISRYNDKTQKPYYMDSQLAKANVDVYLLLGDHDLLFPYKNSIANAKKHLSRLKEVEVFTNVGHGIETHPQAISYLKEIIMKWDNTNG
jgi:pimeloyl-ACP methyl ester carboxylesterase